MLRTNTLKTRENIRNYIIANCDASGYIGYSIDTEPQTWDEIKKFIVDTFTAEMVKHDKRYETHCISIQELFYEWCQGLPSALDTCYYYNRSAVDDLATILEETEAEKNKYNERQAEERLTHLIFLELFK